MKKSICKECGKELSKNAEICPNCGVRVRFNFKNSLKISLLTIFVLIIIGLIVIFGLVLKNKLVEMREKRNLEQLTIKENEMFDSYLSNYKISYNENFKEENPSFVVSDNISLINKCFMKNLSDVRKGDIVKNCINFANAKTIENYEILINTPNIYKINNNKTFIIIYLDNLIDQSSKININDPSRLKERNKLHETICFEFKNSDTLEQIKCPSKNKYLTFNINDKFTTKYEFILTKIK